MKNLNKLYSSFFKKPSSNLSPASGNHVLNIHSCASALKFKAASRNTLSIALISIMLSSCSGYKSSWDCPKVKGIGCSSLEYADEVARKQILLNAGEKQKKNILIKRNSDHSNTDYFNDDNFVEEEIY